MTEETGEVQAISAVPGIADDFKQPFPGEALKFRAYQIFYGSPAASDRTRPA